MIRWWIPLLAIAVLCGCATSSNPPVNRDDVIFLVPGVGGPMLSYQNLIDGLNDARIDRPVQIVGWGAPPVLFFLNFNSVSIHESAERALAGRITRWHAAHPGARIDIIAHSAGCGVTLGALQRLKNDNVEMVVLLAPSVSPKYDLAPAVQHVNDSLHAFVSRNDKTFLEWRTGTFGTYDNVKTAAAGNRGFVVLPARTFQHTYDTSWRSLGNDGDHFGTLARKFTREIIAPLLSAPANGLPAPSQSFAESPR